MNPLSEAGLSVTSTGPSKQNYRSTLSARQVRVAAKRLSENAQEDLASASGEESGASSARQNAESAMTDVCSGEPLDVALADRRFREVFFFDFLGEKDAAFQTHMH
jgi:hypothetical protein